MMAYGNGYALCVLHDGSPVREIHGKVSIPFHSEYKVRLKNKHGNLRTKARVWIDGRKVSNLGDFILHAGETLDLERFLDCDMDTGNKFKFVPLSDSRVNDPTDSENGIIKVEFYREQEFVIDWTQKIHVPTTPRQPYNPWGGDGRFYGDTPTWVGSTGGVNDYTRTTTTSRIKSSGFVYDCYYVNHVAEAPVGATVEGGVSNQKFVEGLGFMTESSPTVLTLRLSNTKTRERPRSRQETARIRYCPGCGKRRQRRADKFCTRCGGGY